MLSCPKWFWACVKMQKAKDFERGFIVGAQMAWASVTDTAGLAAVSTWKVAKWNLQIDLWELLQQRVGRWTNNRMNSVRDEIRWLPEQCVDNYMEGNVSRITVHSLCTGGFADKDWIHFPLRGNGCCKLIGSCSELSPVSYFLYSFCAQVSHTTVCMPRYISEDVNLPLTGCVVKSYAHSSKAVWYHSSAGHLSKFPILWACHQVKRSTSSYCFLSKNCWGRTLNPCSKSCKKP